MSDPGESASRGGLGGTGQRIQFSDEKPTRGQGQGTTTDGHSRSHSIPQVITGEEKDRRQRQNEKNINVLEHLLAPQEVAARYKTLINLDKPADSLGLTTQQAASLAEVHGRNVLTPPKKRNPFLVYIDYLTSLFNLLLILAGILEYILLGIDFKDNFPNVSFFSSSALIFYDTPC